MAIGKEAQQAIASAKATETKNTPTNTAAMMAQQQGQNTNKYLDTAAKSRAANPVNINALGAGGREPKVESKANINVKNIVDNVAKMFTSPAKTETTTPKTNFWVGNNTSAQMAAQQGKNKNDYFDQAQFVRNATANVWTPSKNAPTSVKAAYEQGQNTNKYLNAKQQNRYAADIAQERGKAKTNYFTPQNTWTDPRDAIIDMNSDMDAADKAKAALEWAETGTTTMSAYKNDAEVKEAGEQIRNLWASGTNADAWFGKDRKLVIRQGEESKNQNWWYMNTKDGKDFSNPAAVAKNQDRVVDWVNNINGYMYGGNYNDRDNYRIGWDLKDIYDAIDKGIVPDFELNFEDGSTMSAKDWVKSKQEEWSELSYQIRLDNDYVDYINGQNRNATTTTRKIGEIDDLIRQAGDNQAHVDRLNELREALEKSRDVDYWREMQNAALVEASLDEQEKKAKQQQENEYKSMFGGVPTLDETESEKALAKIKEQREALEKRKVELTEEYESWHMTPEVAEAIARLSDKHAYDAISRQGGIMAAQEAHDADQAAVDAWRAGINLGAKSYNFSDRMAGSIESGVQGILGGLSGAAAAVASAVVDAANADWEATWNGEVLDLIRTDDRQAVIQARNTYNSYFGEGAYEQDFGNSMKIQTAEEEIARLEEENAKLVGDIPGFDPISGETLASVNANEKKIKELEKQIKDWKAADVKAGISDKPVEAYFQSHADEYDEKSQAAIAKALNGAGKLESYFIKGGKTLTEMGFDMAVGSVTGGGSLIPMWVRVFGQEASTARRDGANIYQQLAYGGAKAGIEVFTEKLFGMFDNIGYGKGMAAEMSERIVASLADTPLGMTLVRGLINAGEEGLEEYISDLLAPVADMIYREESFKDLKAEELANGLEDFILGAAMGALGFTGGIVTGQNNALNIERYERDLTNDIIRNTDPENLTAASRAVNKVQQAKNSGDSNVAPENQLTREEYAAAKQLGLITPENARSIKAPKGSLTNKKGRIHINSGGARPIAEGDNRTERVVNNLVEGIDKVGYTSTEDVDEAYNKGTTGSDERAPSAEGAAGKGPGIETTTPPPVNTKGGDAWVDEAADQEIEQTSNNPENKTIKEEYSDPQKYEEGKNQVAESISNLQESNDGGFGRIDFDSRPYTRDSEFGEDGIRTVTSGLIESVLNATPDNPLVFVRADRTKAFRYNGVVLELVTTDKDGNKVTRYIGPDKVDKQLLYLQGAADATAGKNGELPIWTEPMKGVWSEERYNYSMAAFPDFTPDSAVASETAQGEAQGSAPTEIAFAPSESVKPNATPASQPTPVSQAAQNAKTITQKTQEVMRAASTAQPQSGTIEEQERSENDGESTLYSTGVRVSGRSGSGGYEAVPTDERAGERRSADISRNRIAEATESAPFAEGTSGVVKHWYSKTCEKLERFGNRITNRNQWPDGILAFESFLKEDGSAFLSLFDGRKSSANIYGLFGGGKNKNAGLMLVYHDGQSTGKTGVHEHLHDKIAGMESSDDYAHNAFDQILFDIDKKGGDSTTLSYKLMTAKDALLFDFGEKYIPRFLPEFDMVAWSQCESVNEGIELLDKFFGERYSQNNQDAIKRYQQMMYKISEEAMLYFAADERTRFPDFNESEYVQLRDAVRSKLTTDQVVNSDFFSDIDSRINAFDRAVEEYISDMSENIDSPSSLTKLDTEYLDAVERKDKKKITQLVRAAARKAGYKILAYHGSSAKGFTSFDRSFQKYGLFATGFYFTESKNIAETYQSKEGDTRQGVYTVYLNSSKELNMDKPATLDEELKWRERADQLGFGTEFANSIDKIASEDGHFTNTDLFHALENSIPLEMIDDPHIEATRNALKQLDDLEERYVEIEFQEGNGWYNTYFVSLLLTDDPNGAKYKYVIENYVGEEVGYASDEDDLIKKAYPEKVEDAKSKGTKVEEFIRSMGYTGLTHIGGLRVGARTGTGEHTVHIVYDPAQIKSAEPIIYDEDGAVIPLSERFNVDEDDIRYSVGPSQQTGRTPGRVTQSQSAIRQSKEGLPNKGEERTTKENVRSIDNEFDTGDGTYISRSNEERSQTAKFKTETNGKFDQAKADKETRRLLEKDYEWTDDDVVLAQKLMYDMLKGIRDFQLHLTKRMSREAFNNMVKNYNALALKHTSTLSKAGQALQANYNFSLAEKITMKAAKAFLGFSQDGRFAGANPSAKHAKVYTAIEDASGRIQKAVEAKDAGKLAQICKDISEIRNIKKMFGPLAGFADKFETNMLERIAAQENGVEVLEKLAYGNLNAICDDIQPYKVLNAAKTIRVMNMLSNMATIVNNVGNNWMQGVTGNNALAQAMTQIAAKPFQKLSGNPIVANSKVGRNLLTTKGREAARQISNAEWEAFQEATLMQIYGINVENGRLELNDKGAFNPNANAFEQVMSNYKFLIGMGVEATDQVKAAGLLKSMELGIDERIAKSDVSPEERAKLKEKMMAEAKHEVNKLLYKDNNQTTALVQHLRDWLNKKAHLGNEKTGTIGLGDITMAFAKIPTNVIRARLLMTPEGALYNVARYAHGVMKAKRMHSETLARGIMEDAALNKQIADINAQLEAVCAQPKSEAKDARIKELRAKLKSIDNAKWAMAREQCSGSVYNNLQKIRNKFAQSMTFDQAATHAGYANAEEMNEFEMAQLSRRIGRAATSAGMLVLGAMLRGLGALRDFDQEPDEEIRAMNKQKGYTGLMLNLSAIGRKDHEWKDGDTILDAEWLECIAMPLAIGATAAECAEGADGFFGKSKAYALEAFGGGFVKSFEAAAEIPGMADAINMYNSFNNAYSTDNAAKGAKAINGGILYLANTLPSFIVPNAFSQAAAGIDNTMRDVYTTDNVWEQAWNTMKNKGGLVARRSIPASVDMWGDERTYGENWMHGLVNKSLLPGDVKVYHKNTYESEIERLMKAGYTSAGPKVTTNGTFEVDNTTYTMTAEEKRGFKQNRNSAQAVAFKAFMDSDEYQKLEDWQREAVFKALKTSAERDARQEVLRDRELDVEVRRDSWESKLSSLDEQIQFLAEKQVASSMYDNENKTFTDYKNLDKFIQGDYQKLNDTQKQLMNDSVSHLDDLSNAWTGYKIDSEMWQKAYDIYRDYNSEEGKARVEGQYKAYEASQMYAEMQKATGATDAQMKFFESKDGMKLWNQNTPDSDHYYTLTDQGIDRGKVSNLITDMAMLQPTKGRKEVSAKEKFTKIATADYFSEEEKWDAFEDYVPSNYTKVIPKMKALRNQGVSLEAALKQVKQWEEYETKAS